MAAAKELDVLTGEYEQVQATIRQTSPRYAALTQPVPLELKDIQTDVLDPDTPRPSKMREVLRRIGMPAKDSGTGR